MYASIYHKQATDEQVKAEIADMLEVYSAPANRDQVHLAFADVHPDTVSPVIPSKWVDGDDNPVVGDALAWGITQLLPQVNTVIWLTRSEVRFLDSYPAWRIWCADYQHRRLFESDWEYVTQLIASKMPEAASTWPEYNEELTYAQGREIVFSAVAANAGWM